MIAQPRFNALLVKDVVVVGLARQRDDFLSLFHCAQTDAAVSHIALYYQRCKLGARLGTRIGYVNNDLLEFVDNVGSERNAREQGSSHHSCHDTTGMFGRSTSRVYLSRITRITRVTTVTTVTRVH